MSILFHCKLSENKNLQLFDQHLWNMSSKIQTTQVPTALHWSYIYLTLHEHSLLEFQLLWLHFCAIQSFFKNTVGVSIFYFACLLFKQESAYMGSQKLHVSLGQQVIDFQAIFSYCMPLERPKCSSTTDRSHSICVTYHSGFTIYTKVLHKINAAGNSIIS